MSLGNGRIEMGVNKETKIIESAWPKFSRATYARMGSSDWETRSVGMGND
jgi:hypothetical protein